MRAQLGGNCSKKGLLYHVYKGRGEIASDDSSSTKNKSLKEGKDYKTRCECFKAD